MRVFLLLFLFALCGCSEKIKSSLGLAASSPDEFSVIEHKSLVVPPQFTLPEPQDAVGTKKDSQVSDKKSSLSREDKKFVDKLNSK